MASIFISYRRADAAPYAGRLHDRLVAEFTNAAVFMDLEIRPGDDFVERLEDGVSKCRVLLALIGPNWLSAADRSGARRLDDPDDFTRIEIRAALDRGIRVIPVLVGGAIMPRGDELPEALASLSRRQAIELSDVRFQSDASRLVEVIRAELATLDEAGGEGQVPHSAKAPEVSAGSGSALRIEDQGTRTSESQEQPPAAEPEEASARSQIKPSGGGDLAVEPATAQGISEGHHGSWQTASWLGVAMAATGIGLFLTLFLPWENPGIGSSPNAFDLEDGNAGLIAGVALTVSFVGMMLVGSAKVQRPEWMGPLSLTAVLVAVVSVGVTAPETFDRSSPGAGGPLALGLALLAVVLACWSVVVSRRVAEGAASS